MFTTDRNECLSRKKSLGRLELSSDPDWPIRLVQMEKMMRRIFIVARRQMERICYDYTIPMCIFTGIACFCFVVAL